MERKLYFAYGSNTDIGSMAARCPKARPMGKAVVRGYRLVFRGVADILRSESDVVHGALWSITRKCEQELDEFEGFPHLYTKRLVKVITENGEDLETMVYVMSEEVHKMAPLEPPTNEYRDLIAQGYKDFDIPMWQLIRALREARLADEWDDNGEGHWDNELADEWETEACPVPGIEVRWLDVAPEEFRKQWLI